MVGCMLWRPRVVKTRGCGRIRETPGKTGVVAAEGQPAVEQTWEGLELLGMTGSRGNRESVYGCCGVEGTSFQWSA